MTTGTDEEIKRAIEVRDAVRLGRIVDSLRMRGVNYQQLYNRARKLTGVTLAEWDALMEEADDADSKG